MKFIVGSGQSGAVSGWGMEGGDLSVNPNVFIWKDDTMEWVVADPSKPPFKPATANGVLNNTLWNFCKEVQESTGEKVYFVLSGKGGTPISEWGDNKEQWLNLDNAVRHARQSTETFNAKVDYFGWYHGEADKGNENYKNDFLDLRARAISSGWLEEDTRIVWGTPNNNLNQAKEALLNMIGSGNYQWLHVADNYGVEYVKNGTGVHVTGNGAVQYGEAFYDAAMETYQKLNHWSGATHFNFGTFNDDELRETIDNTYMIGGTGNDRLASLSENTILSGGEGDDLFILRGDFTNNRVGGGEGDDILRVYLQEGDTYTYFDNKITINDGDSFVYVWNTEVVNFLYV